MTTQQNSSITTNSNTDLDNFIVTVEDNQDVVIIDTCKNRIGVNTIDPSYSIDVRSRQDVSGTIYTSYLKTGNIISSLIPYTDNTDMSHNLGSINKSWNRIDASYIEISGVTIKDANQFTIGEGSGGAGIVFPTDISINGDMCCNNITVDGITINDANKFSIGEATNESGITFPLDISINGNLTVTGTVNSTYLVTLIQGQETELQYQYEDFETDKTIIAYDIDVSNIDVSNINIKENILFNGISPKQDQTIVYDGSKVLWKTRGENLVNYVENNVIETSTPSVGDIYYNSDYKLKYNPPPRSVPTISLIGGDVSAALDLSGEYSIPSATAIDYRGFSISAEVSSVYGPGEYTLDYSATDREGRTSTITTNFTVHAMYDFMSASLSDPHTLTFYDGRTATARYSINSEKVTDNTNIILDSSGLFTSTYAYLDGGEFTLQTNYSIEIIFKFLTGVNNHNSLFTLYRNHGSYIRVGQEYVYPGGVNRIRFESVRSDDTSYDRSKANAVVFYNPTGIDLTEREMSQFIHLVVTFSNEDDHLDRKKCYINNMLAEQSSNTINQGNGYANYMPNNDVYTYNNILFGMGRLGDDKGSEYIKYVNIYDHTLNATEITNLYNSAVNLNLLN